MSKENSTAIITGGARGIGKAYVEALLERDFVVAILDLKGAEETAFEFNEKFGPNRVCGYQCDVSNSENFRETFDAAWMRILGWVPEAVAIDVLILNAGIFGNLFDKTETIVRVNLLSTICGTEMYIKKATASLSRPASKPLLIVITSSSNGLIPADSDFAPVYVATKFGINGFVYSMKPLCSRMNIRINAIAPVTVRTPMIEEAGLTTEVIEFLNEENRGGILSSKDVSQVLIRILDDTSLNGQVITVHPSVLPDGKAESLDPNNHYQYLGNWSESKSEVIKEYVDTNIKAVVNGDLKGWSGI